MSTSGAAGRVAVWFRNRPLRRAFERRSEAVRTWGVQVGERYIERVRLIIDAPHIQMLFDWPEFKLHPLHGDLEGFYSGTLAGRWRLLLSFSEDDGIEVVVIEDVSNHYGD